MNKKILIGLIVLVLVGVIALLALKGNDSGQASTLVPTSPSTAPTVAPATSVTPTTASGTITVQEFLKNAQVNGYKKGQELKVTAVYEGKGRISVGGSSYDFYFGPRVNGLVLMANVITISSSILGFTELSKGATVIIQGEYEGPAENPDPDSKERQVKGIRLKYARIYK